VLLKDRQSRKAKLTTYRIVLFIIQVPFIANLFNNNDTGAESLNTAANLAPHFITHNLLIFGFVHLWCRAYFGWALLLIIVNFFQLTFAYFKYPKTAKITHAAILAGPLAFSFVALYWDGAAAVHSRHFAARIVANIFIWTWAVYGAFYLVVFKDWAMGFALSVLAACEYPLRMSTITTDTFQLLALPNSSLPLSRSNGSKPSPSWDFSLSSP
jgi:hypothetical protein